MEPNTNTSPQNEFAPTLCLGGSPIQSGRYVRIHLNTADGGHRGADANTDYVGPQQGKVLTAAAPAAAV